MIGGLLTWDRLRFPLSICSYIRVKNIARASILCSPHTALETLLILLHNSKLNYSSSVVTSKEYRFYILEFLKFRKRHYCIIKPPY